MPTAACLQRWATSCAWIDGDLAGSTAEANSLIGKTSRQLALLFMVIFEAQAERQQALLGCSDWLIDREWLMEVHEQQQEVLNAEGIAPDGLVELINRACTLGFALSEPSGWRLLPAVCRYLDHFEALAATEQAAQHDPDQLMDSAFAPEEAEDEEDL